MPDILHRVGIRSSPLDVYKGLATRAGLALWWTSDTQGEDKVGGVIDFRFGDHGFIAMKVLELDPGKRVLWEVVGGPGEWIGTKVIFDLKKENDYAIVLFNHKGWKETSEFMHHCGTKWAVFLLSLKAQLETGKGSPWPNDTEVDNWD